MHLEASQVQLPRRLPITNQPATINIHQNNRTQAEDSLFFIQRSSHAVHLEAPHERHNARNTSVDEGILKRHAAERGNEDFSFGVAP
jgi:hypothetical protein